MRRLCGLLLLTVGCDCGGESLGQLDALIAPSSTGLDFGQVHTGGEGSLTLGLESLGEAPVRIGALEVGAGPFSVESAPQASIFPGQSATINVTFRPVDIGAVSGVLRIDNDSKNAPQISISLLGEGLAGLDCDDQQACTNDSFDPNSGECRHEDRQGPCDDGSACTEDEVCSAGQCRGTAIDCDSSNECTRALCDPALGCVYVPDDGLCDDENPCTRDSCDPSSGCEHEDLPDGASCGEGVQCISAQVCIFGTCRDFEIPDGFPCSDGNICTVSDFCVLHRCTGTRQVSLPTVEGFVRTYGVRSELFATDMLNRAAILSGRRIVFGDWDGTPRNESTLTLSAVLGNLEMVSSATTAGRIYDLEASAADTILAVTATISNGSFSAFARLFQVESNGRLRGRATMLLPGLPWAAALHPTVAYFCEGFRGVRTFDLSDPDHPLEVTNLLGSIPCEDLALDLPRDRLLVVSAGGVREYDLSDPTAPLFVAVHFPNDAVVGLSVWGPLGVARSGAVRAFFIDLATMTRTSTVNLSLLNAEMGDGFAALHDGAQVRFYDLRDPFRPLPLASWPAPLGRSIAGGQDLLISDAPAYGNTQRVYEVDPSASLPVRWVSGPGHGSLSAFLSSDILVGPDSVHRIDLSDPQQPRFTLSSDLGTPPPNLVDVSGAKQLGYSSGFDGPTIPFGWQAVSRVDASNLRTPLAAGHLLPAYGTLATDPSVQTLYDATYDQLHVYDLQGLPPSAGVPLLLGSYAFPVGIASALLAVDQTASHLVLVSTPDVSPFSSDISLFDISARGAPILIGHRNFPGRHMRSSAVSDDKVVTLEWSLSPFNLVSGDEYAGIRLLRFQPGVGGTLDWVRTASVSHARHVMAFDGETAFLSTSIGLLVLDTTQSPPRYRYELPLPQVPISMRVVDDRLVLLSNTGVTVVYPPCPP